jgi:hypothetical protein
MQHGAFDSLRGLLVRAIVLDIDRCRGTVLFADSMDPRRIAVSGNVLFENLLAERPLPEWVMKNSLGSAEQVALWQRLLLREQNPRPVGLGESRIRPAPGFQDRNHVEHSKAFHTLGMIQGQPVRDASSAVMADQREGRKSKPSHHPNQFLRHRPLRIRKMVADAGTPLRPYARRSTQITV